MSSRAENWAWERDDVKGITKFVLVYLARRAYYDDGAAAWPSVKTIAFNCGCCERTVIRSLQELERKGYIRPGDQEMSARNPRTRKPIAEWRYEQSHAFSSKKEPRRKHPDTQRAP